MKCEDAGALSGLVQKSSSVIDLMSNRRDRFGAPFCSFSKSGQFRLLTLYSITVAACV